jgi:predicted permease
MREELESVQALAREDDDPVALGNLTRAAESARESWGGIWWDRLSQDLRYTARSLRAAPAFAAISILTLALGIGANTTIFTAVSAVFLRPLPVRNHDALRLLTWTSPKRAFGGRFLTQPMWDANVLNRGEGMKYFSYPVYLDLREHASSFASLACTRPGPSVNLPDGRTEGVQAVSGNFFTTLGVDAALGRVITSEDDRPGAPPAITISYSTWQTSFGGDPAILTRSLQLGLIRAPIVGVLSPDFFGLDPAFRYRVMTAIQPALANAVPPVLSDAHNWNGCQAVLGILRPGVSAEQARVDTETLIDRAILADPPREEWIAPRVRIEDLGRGFDTLRKAAGEPFGLLVAVSILILLIACANLAGLLLARGAARQREIATRLALGASQGRVVRQLMTESLTISAIGGCAGAAIAYGCSPLLPKLFQQFNYYQFANLGVGFRPDTRVFLFSAALAGLTGLLFGLIPALRTVRAALVAAMKGSPTSRRFRFTSGRMMLAAQVAFSMVLLIGAGLLLRTLWNLQSVPMGYDPNGILYFTVATPPNRQEFVSRVTEQLGSLPGVASATVSIWPLFTSAPDTYLQVCAAGDQPKSFDDHFADSDYILPRFFETWRVPLLSGRDFRAGEPLDNVIVNDAFVRRYLTGTPLGASVRLGPKCESAAIVGVVANSTDRPRITPRPFVYRPYAYQPTQLTFTVRAAGDPSTLIAPARRIVADLNTRVFDPLTTGVDYRNRTMNQERLFSALLSVFGGLALFIAFVGIYGMTAYMVRRRTPEIGIRMSLGARPSDVIRLVIRQALAPVAAGAAAGSFASIALAKLLSSILFGVSRGDPAAIAAAAFLLVLTAISGAAGPAWIASRIDPKQALHYE